ncbi:hypothetical protein AGMMS49992_01520 [Clostridia bacterium]|nr:hypothetical protein AGMMS49992_01520 [Clostridia bacterium]
MQYQSYANRPVSQPYATQGYGQQPYQPPMPQARPYTPPPAPVPQQPRYAQPPVSIAQTMPSTTTKRPPKIPMPMDYNPKHPPIGFMPEVPLASENFSGGMVMSDDTSSVEQMGQRRGSRRSRNNQQSRQSEDSRSGRDTPATRAMSAAMQSAAMRAEAAKPDNAEASARIETALADFIQADQAQEVQSEPAPRPAEPTRVEARPTVQLATATRRTEPAPRQSSKPVQRGAAPQAAGKTPSAFDGLPLPIECLLLTGEPIEVGTAGEYTVKFHEPMIHRGVSFSFRAETKTIDIAEDGVYHIAYSGRVSAREKSDLWGRSGLQVVHDNGGLMHGIQIDHDEDVPFRASFLGECKAGQRLRLQWQVENLKTPLTLNEPIIFIERLK